MKISRLTLCLLLALALAPGCGHRTLIATPNLLQDTNPYGAFEGCASDCQSAEMPVMYATDRAIIGRDGEQASYGHGRSNSLAFGVANVSLDPQPTWRELMRESTKASRSRNYELKVSNIHEVARLKPSVEELGERGTFVLQTSLKEPSNERSKLHELLRGRLSQTANKDVFIFVHGFNNTFDDAIFRAGEVWHFMGRVGVPVAYSWPAGLGGVRGYAYDRESGEFTVSHLRRFIKATAECPDVERVHLIAHSRGVDVTVSALRELNIAYRAQGKSTREELKLANLVLAAPDIDEEVFMQRFVGEHLLQAADRTTIYASPHDKAIELSDVIFASRRRLGLLAVKDFSPKMKYALSRMPNVQFIECKVSGFWMSHSYVFTHPAALSDLILVLRDRRDPGAANGRPLAQPSEGIWELNDDYLVVKDARR